MRKNVRHSCFHLELFREILRDVAWWKWNKKWRCLPRKNQLRARMKINRTLKRHSFWLTSIVAQNLNVIWIKVCVPSFIHLLLARVTHNGTRIGSILCNPLYDDFVTLLHISPYLCHIRRGEITVKVNDLTFCKVLLHMNYRFLADFIWVSF